MSPLGLPVPLGLTITTEACTHYYANNRSYPPKLREHVAAALKLIEVVTFIQKHFPRPNHKDLYFLKQLSRVILLGCNPEKYLSALSSDIANSMKAYESKQTRAAKRRRDLRALY